MPLKHEPRPIHLRPAAELAERVLLPGDPHRALAVAQHLLDGPKMFNHSRGLWGYTGVAADGELLTIQSTGMGGPSAAIVVEELIALGARRLVRIGTCGALDSGLALGDLVAAESVLPADGTSTALGANGAVAPDAGLPSYRPHVLKPRPCAVDPVLCLTSTRDTSRDRDLPVRQRDLPRAVIQYEGDLGGIGGGERL